MLTLVKLRGSWNQKAYYLKLHMYVHAPSKFQVSSIILTSFRQGEILLSAPSTAKRTTSEPTNILILGLIRAVISLLALLHLDLLR